MNLVLFKGIGLLILFVFAFYVSDFRNKKGMIPIVNKKLVLFLKLFYSVPVCLYIYVLMVSRNLLSYSYIGLILTFMGTVLVVKAKIDLGKFHTWAGHKLCNTKIITKGIYAFIRHPIYTGIYIFIFGALMFSINNNPFSFYFTILIIIMLVFIMFFLATTALKESNFLHKKFGDKFLTYKKQVHSFLPISRYNFSE